MQHCKTPLSKVGVELSTWLAFFAASWAISISPGAGAVAAMTAGINHGFQRGITICFGLILGIWTQVLIVGAGLGAIVATSAFAFFVIKWLGVLYLVWLGIQQWRAPAEPMVAKTQNTGHVPRRSMVLQGWMVNAVNPKGTVFLLAVVPQFLDLNQPLWPQYGVIAATLAFTDLVVMGAYTALAARILVALKSPSHVILINRVFGTLFIAAGSMLALFKR